MPSSGGWLFLDSESELELAVDLDWRQCQRPGLAFGPSWQPPLGTLIKPSRLKARKQMRVNKSNARWKAQKRKTMNKRMLIKAMLKLKCLTFNLRFYFRGLCFYLNLLLFFGFLTVRVASEPQQSSSIRAKKLTLIKI